MISIGRDHLENATYKKLAKLSARHRKELEGLLGDPPNPANVPPEFWVRVESEMNRDLGIALAIIFMSSASHWDMDGGDAEDAAAIWSNDRSAQLAADYTTTSRDRLASLAGGWVDEPTTTRRELRTELSGIFGPSRSANVATTETTRAITAGAVRAAQDNPQYQAGELGIYWRLGPNENHCPLCSRVADTESKSWGQYSDGPPAHPNCGCYLELVQFSKDQEPDE